MPGAKDVAPDNLGPGAQPTALHTDLRGFLIDPCGHEFGGAERRYADQGAFDFALCPGPELPVVRLEQRPMEAFRYALFDASALLPDSNVLPAARVPGGHGLARDPQADRR